MRSKNLGKHSPSVWSVLFLWTVLAVVFSGGPVSAQDDSIEQDDVDDVECEEPLDETTVTGELIAIEEQDGSPWSDGYTLANVSPDGFYAALIGTVRGEVAVSVLGRGELLVEGDRYEFVISQFLLTSGSDNSPSLDESPILAELEGIDLPEGDVEEFEIDEALDPSLASIATLEDDSACLAGTSIRAMSSDGPVDIEIPPGIVERLRNSYPTVLLGFAAFAGLIFIFGREPRG